MKRYNYSGRRKNRALSLILSVFVFFVAIVDLRTLAQSGYSIDEVRRVLSLIERMAEEQRLKNSEDLKSVQVTESEFNAYMAYLIDANQEEVLREVYVNLLKKNRLEGKISIDLRGQRIPRFLKPEMNFYFAGRLQVDNGRAKLSISELFLESEPVQPALLDLAILISSRIQGVEPVSLSDWYELPYGIKDIQTREGIAIFYY